jgi:hypothetical protein
MTWAPGRFERRRRTPTILCKMGRLMALLHEVSFLSRPEFSDYAPRFMNIVGPKTERYLLLNAPLS